MLSDLSAQVVEGAGVFQNEVPLLPLHSAFGGMGSPRLLGGVRERTPQVPDLEPPGAKDGGLVLEANVGGHDKQRSGVEREPLRDYPLLLRVALHAEPHKAEIALVQLLDRCEQLVHPQVFPMSAPPLRTQGLEEDAHRGLATLGDGIAKLAWPPQCIVANPEQGLDDALHRVSERDLHDVDLGQGLFQHLGYRGLAGPGGGVDAYVFHGTSALRGAISSIAPSICSVGTATRLPSARKMVVK